MLKNYPLPIKIIIISVSIIFVILMLACNDKRKKGENIEDKIITQNSKPDVPEKVSAIGLNSNIVINWNTVKNAKSYNIYWSEESSVNKANGFKISGINTNTYTHEGLDNGVPYYYVVTAVTSHLESNESNIATAIPQKYLNIILDEDFEDNELDNRISIETIGIFKSNPMIKKVTNFGSENAFGFGKSICAKACSEDYVSCLVISFTDSTCISNIMFKEMELSGNWGSNGIVYIDDRIQLENFGRLPVDDNKSDEVYRFRNYTVNQYTKKIELKVKNITNTSEIFIDDLIIIGENNYKKDNMKIKAGKYHSIALKGDRTVWTWGNNEFGQLGDGTNTDKANPVEATGLTNITAITGGGNHSIALKNDSTLWIWGNNKFGQARW